MIDTTPKPARRGRPSSEAAESHAAIMDAVYELLQHKSVRDLTMEAVAKRAGVGKPTLYKWWPTKAALVFAMFHERMGGKAELPVDGTVEQVLRAKVRHLVREFNGLFGKVMAELIAEGQSEPVVLQELYDQHMKVRQESGIADIRQAMKTGEFRADTNPQILIDSIIGAIYFRLLVRHVPLSEEFADELITQVLNGVRTNPPM